MKGKAERCKHGVRHNLMCLSCEADRMLGGYQDQSKARPDLSDRRINEKDEDTIDQQRGER